jgi:hypothetical protein
MSPAARLFFLAGCVAIAAAASPLCARVAVEDILGPYAQVVPPRVADARSERAAAEEIEVVLETNAFESTGDHADELDHDAP